MEVKRLHGYQNTTPETFGEGLNVSIDGKVYDLLNFKDEYVDLELIAISLSRIVRYTGHTEISVAQHSYMMAHSFIMMGDIDKAFQAWGHDQAETYLGDIVNPVKKLIKSILNPIEEEIESIIAKHFGYRYPFDPEVIDLVDKNASQMEMVLMRHPELFDDDYCWDRETAKKRYIEMYELLKQLKIYDKKPLVK